MGYITILPYLYSTQKNLYLLAYVLVNDTLLIKQGQVNSGIKMRALLQLMTVSVIYVYVYH